MNTLQVEKVDIESIFSDPRNARIHSEKQLYEIAQSLTRFGQQKPIVVNSKNIVIAGNGQYLAAKTILGWDEISITRSELSEQEAQAYAIADNQIGLNSEWDLEMLSEHIQELGKWDTEQNWDSLGLDEDIVKPLFEGEASPETVAEVMQEFLNSEPASEQSSDKPAMAPPIKVTAEMRETIETAINMVRYYQNDPKMSEGRALELVCADWATGSAKQVEN